MTEFYAAANAVMGQFDVFALGTAGQRVLTVVDTACWHPLYGFRRVVAVLD